MSKKRTPSGRPATDPAKNFPEVRAPLGKTGFADLLKNPSVMIGLGAGGTLLLLTVLFFAFSGSGSAPEVDDREPAQASSDKPAETADEGGLPLLPPKFATIACNVYTPEPGFHVTVDGVLARDAEGELLTTPCEVGLLEGNHALGVVKKGFSDITEQVLVASPRSFNFEPKFAPFGEPIGYYGSRFAQAEVGDELALASLNSGGKVFDPFVAPDGLTIWFAGDRETGRGIYIARRDSVLDEFGEPEMLTARTADRPCSPSITRDGLLLTFGIVGKARIWGLSRQTPDGLFEPRQPLRSSDQDEEYWRSVQVAGDGKSLFCMQERNGKKSCYITTRKSRDKKFDGKWTALKLPGLHPCLSSDNLRQYAFDGVRLTRSSRRRLGAEFSRPEVIAELSLRSYVPRDEFRQYFVSEDEQWLYYTDDPEQGGNLYVVRISDGPGWGYKPIGKSIPQRAMVASTDEPDEPETSPEARPAKPAEAPVDPRTLPLPYAGFRQKFVANLRELDLAAAEKLLAAAEKDSVLRNDRELLKWDREELQQVQGFWADFRRAIAALKPGDPIRLGPVTVDFVSFQDDVITGKARTKDVSKNIREMTTGDLIALVDRVVERDNQAEQLRVATYLSFVEDVNEQLLASRLERAGVAGRQLVERVHKRTLHLIEQEYARQNIGQGLQLTDALIAAAPKSETATRALALRDKLYEQMEWRAVGGQTWNTSRPGEYETTGRRSENSFLVSPGEFKNFQLSLEWKTVGLTAQGGVYFRYKGGDGLRGNSFKVHLANDYNLRGSPDRFSTGSLFSLNSPKVNAVRKEGEWNTLLMRVDGDRIRVTVNGQEVLETPMNDPNVGNEGYICIDGEFTGITYRKILVYELPPKATNSVAPRTKAE